jgi:ADP-ribosyl-[dinitrogen reductase] hydrolase
MTALIIGALQGATKENLLSDHFVPGGLPVDYWTTHPLAPEVAAIARGSYRSKRSPNDKPAACSAAAAAATSEPVDDHKVDPNVIRGSGYVIGAFEAALWALWKTDSFEAGALAAVNLGNDADTTAAIYGQLAGALYGAEAIPKDWRDSLAYRALIETFAQEIYALVTNDDYTITAPLCVRCAVGACLTIPLLLCDAGP